jgi:hypothetical protein
VSRRLDARDRAGLRPGQDLLAPVGARVWHPSLGSGTVLGADHRGGCVTYGVEWDSPPTGRKRSGVGGHLIAPAPAGQAD